MVAWGMMGPEMVVVGMWGWLVGQGGDGYRGDSGIEAVGIEVVEEEVEMVVMIMEMVFGADGPINSDGDQDGGL